MIALLCAAWAADVDPTAAPAAPVGPDRSAPPPVAAPELLSYDEPQKHALGPGVEAWYVRVPGVRKVVVDLVFGRGLVELDGGPSQPGRATGWLADVAAGELDAAALSEQTDLLDIDVRSGLGLHDGGVELTVPLEALDQGLDLQRLVLREASFPKKDVKRWVADQQLFYTVSGPASQGTVASSALAFAWFPADHPYGDRPELDELRQVSSKELAARWQGWIRGAPITAVVVGDVEWSAIEPKLRAMVEGLGQAAERADGLPVEPPAASRVIAVDMPGQAQVAVRLRTAAPPRDHEDQPEMIAASWAFGGHFLSRLNKNLREEKGFTYGSRGHYRADETWGNLTVEVDVKAENLGATLTEIAGELERLATEPPGDAELDAMRRSFAADWNRALENAPRAAGLYAQALDEERALADLRARQQAVAAVTTADVEKVARTWLGADRPRVWVVVGDRAAIEDQLGVLGVAPEWVDPSAAILGNF